MFVPLAALTEASEVAQARRDPKAAIHLVDLLAAGEQRNYVADFRVTRTYAAHKAFADTESEARWHDAFVTRGGGGLTIKLPSSTLTCVEIDDKPSCQEIQTKKTLPTSAVLTVAIGSGAYDAIEIGGETIAGVHARCFRLTGHWPHVLEAFGTATDICVSPDGIVVRTRAPGPDFTEDRVATRLRTGIDETAIEPLLAGFQSAGAGVGR